MTVYSYVFLFVAALPVTAFAVSLVEDELPENRLVRKLATLAVPVLAAGFAYLMVDAGSYSGVDVDLDRPGIGPIEW